MKRTRKVWTGFMMLFAVLATVTVVTKNVQAASSDFTIENGVLVKYNGNGGNVVIPKNVTSIGASAFVGCNSLISVTIPDGVTSIDHSAFNSCLNLTSVALPDSLKTIGAGAFQACSDLMVITIPAHVEEIGAGAFGACDHLRELTLLNPETKLTYVAYEDSSILETAEDPTSFINSVVTIKGYENSTAQELADHMNSKPYYQGKTNFKFVVLGGTGDTLATKQICKLLQKVKVTGSLTIKRGRNKTIKVTLPKGLKQVTKFSGKNKKGQTKISYSVHRGDKTAVVNSQGKVTAKRKGVTTITVTLAAHDGKEVSVRTIRVRVKVQ